MTGISLKEVKNAVVLTSDRRLQVNRTRISEEAKTNQSQTFGPWIDLYERIRINEDGLRGMVFAGDWVLFSGLVSQ